MSMAADQRSVTFEDVGALPPDWSGGITGTGNTIGAPLITGTGATGSPQKLVWSLEDGNADIDIPAGTSVTVSYDVSVLSGLAAKSPTPRM